MEPRQDEYKRQHLEFVQGVITRMAGNSFQIKGFCVAMIALVGGLYGPETSLSALLWLLGGISIACALCDAYYLQLERKYLQLYSDSVARLEDEGRTLRDIYSMDVRAIKVCYCSCLFSRSLFMPYGLILVGLMLYALFGPCYRA